jgi:hypothetical protein
MNIVNAIEKTYETVKTGIDKAYDEVGKFLDNNPILYKIVLIASHFFRALAMFGIMMWMPLPMPVTATAMIGGTLLYRAAVERFCCFRFAIPSMIGGTAAWLTHLAAVNFISGVALSSVGMTIAHALAFIPLLAYTAWVIYISHEDIEKRMALLHPDCCCKA